MKKTVCFLLFLIFLCHAEFVSCLEKPVSAVIHRPHIQRIVFENHQFQTLPSFTMAGFQFDTFFLHSMYYSLAILGAMTGEVPRGGLGVAMMGMGHCIGFNSKTSLYSEFLIGAGGGGQLPVSGGLAFRLNTGIYYRLLNKWRVFLQAGYMSYTLAGTNSLVLSTGVSIDYLHYIKHE